MLLHSYSYTIHAIWHQRLCFVYTNSIHSQFSLAFKLKQVLQGTFTSPIDMSLTHTSNYLWEILLTAHPFFVVLLSNFNSLFYLHALLFWLQEAIIVKQLCLSWLMIIFLAPFLYCFCMTQAYNLAIVKTCFWQNVASKIAETPNTIICKHASITPPYTI